MSRRKRFAVGSVCGVYLFLFGVHAVLSREARYGAELSDSSNSRVSSRNGLALDAKVVYLKGTAVMTANADGSNVRMLVDDGVSKSDPHWSPGGDKIVYWTPGPSAKGSKTLANLIVITASGQQVSTIPVLETELGPWALFRGVQIGWYGNDTVFAAGMVNTVVFDYRLMDVRSGRELRRYSAVGFAVCEARSKVAVATGMEMSGKEFVKVNGTPVYIIPHGSSVFSMNWLADCSHLVFTESSIEGLAANAATLVVLSGDSVEARIPVRAGWWVYAPVGSSFVIGSSSFLVDGESAKALLYDTETQTLSPAPDVLWVIQQRVASEKEAMSIVGGESPDWYRQQ